MGKHLGGGGRSTGTPAQNNRNAARVAAAAQVSAPVVQPTLAERTRAAITQNARPDNREQIATDGSRFAGIRWRGETRPGAGERVIAKQLGTQIGIYDAGNHVIGATAQSMERVRTWAQRNMVRLVVGRGIFD